MVIQTVASLATVACLVLSCSSDSPAGPGSSGGTSSGGSSGAVPATDGQKNNGETDVDCGGQNAPPCEAGKACNADADCKDGFCNPNEKKCAAPRADDGFKNGSETDVDCGGQSGVKCAEGKICVADADCTGACNYTQRCVDVPSCKSHFGGDTCGTKPMYPGEFGDDSADAKNESCCRTLPVPGFDDPSHPGKQVFVDKYEITAGRIRAFIEALAAANGGQPDLKTWIAANKPPLWNDKWNLYLPSGTDAPDIQVEHVASNPDDGNRSRNAGTNALFGSPLYIYVHGHNCGSLPGSFGFPTFFYPDALLTERGEVPRANGLDENGTSIPAKDVLDAKAMTCIPNVILAAFCHWDGGQLATDEVLDFITNAPPNLGSAVGCGTRCAKLSEVQATSDSGSDTGILYRFPGYPDTATHEGTARIAPPGRVFTDVVRINDGDEPWMDLHGNVHEVALDVNGETFTGNFTIKYRGIGYSSARAGGNATPPPPKFSFPEYKAGYSGGRCMRFK